MIIENKNLKSLKSAVTKKFGKEIETLPDCIALAREAEKLGFQVNPQTYRRFFGLIQYNGGFTKYTLSSLARICGYLNYEDFQNQQSGKKIEQNLFQLSTVKNEDDYWQLSEELCQRIIESPELLSRIHYELLPYPLARTYFMEHHPMRDMICTVYSQYFQEYLKYSRSNEARIFAYGFLFIGSFLSNNFEFMQIYHQRVLKTDLTPEVHVIPAGRKFGVPLLFSYKTGDHKTFDSTFQKMLDARIQYQPEYKSTVATPHPLFEGFIKAAVDYHKEKQTKKRVDA